MTREWYNHRPQANRLYHEKNTDHWQLQNNRLHFNEMFGEVFPEVGDYTSDGVCACVRACVYMCFEITINGASAMAYNQKKPENIVERKEKIQLL